MKRVIVGALVSCVVASGLQALDTQAFYRAGLMQRLPALKEQKPVQIALRVASGSTRDAFDGHEHKVPLFSAYGKFDLLRLGTGLDASDLVSKTTTNAFWGSSGHWADLSSGVGELDGKVDVSGRFVTTDVALTAKVPVFFGLYAEALLPFSKLTIDNIKITNRGAATVKSRRMDDFINTSLPLILAENGLTSLTKTIVHDLSIADPVLALGWEGYAARLAPLVTEVAGYVQLGLSLPAASGKDQAMPLDIARGYNGHVGCLGRAAAEAQFFDCVTLGVQAGSSIFFPDRRQVRLKTDIQQQGWLQLKKVTVKEDYGSIWDIGGYVGVAKIVTGLRALVGYSFTRQEVTTYTVKDADYLKDKVAAAHAELPVSVDVYANSDQRLRGWEQHVMRMALQVDTGEMFNTAIGGLVRLEYSIPVLGKYSWATDMVAGSLGCSFVWNF